MGDDDEEIAQKMRLLYDLITFGILIRLSIKSLIRYKYLSKRWYSSISSPHFAIAHFNYFSPFYQPYWPTHSVFVQPGSDYFLLSSDEEQEEGGLDDVKVNKDFYRLDIDTDGIKDEIFPNTTYFFLVKMNFCLFNIIIY